jgi:hypothetical protein
MTDTDRLNKLERLEKKLRKRYWFAVGKSGGIIASPTQDRILPKMMESAGGPWKCLREAIDAAPEPGSPS